MNESLKGGGEGGAVETIILYIQERGFAQLIVTMITPPATPERIGKLKKQLKSHRPILYSKSTLNFVPLKRPPIVLDFLLESC